MANRRLIIAQINGKENGSQITSEMLKKIYLGV